MKRIIAATELLLISPAVLVRKVGTLRGKKRGARNAPPEMNDVELLPYSTRGAGVSGSGVSGSFFFRGRPRNGFTPNSTSFSESFP